MLFHRYFYRDFIRGDIIPAKRECVEFPLNTSIKSCKDLKEYVTNDLKLKFTFHNCIWGLFDFFKKNYKKKN